MAQLIYHVAIYKIESTLPRRRNFAVDTSNALLNSLKIILSFTTTYCNKKPISTSNILSAPLKIFQSFQKPIIICQTLPTGRRAVFKYQPTRQILHHQKFRKRTHLGLFQQNIYQNLSPVFQSNFLRRYFGRGNGRTLNYSVLLCLGSPVASVRLYFGVPPMQFQPWSVLAVRVLHGLPSLVVMPVGVLPPAWLSASAVQLYSGI